MNTRTLCWFLICEAFAAGAMGCLPQKLVSDPKKEKERAKRNTIVAARQLSIYLASTSLNVTHESIADRYRVHRTLVSKITAKMEKHRQISEQLDDWLDGIEEALTALVARMQSSIIMETPNG